MEDSKIRVGVAGAGNWARYGHLPVLKMLPQYELKAISSRRKETAEEIAKTFGIEHAFDSYDLMVNHPEVDLVVVLPPAPQHAVIVRAAIAAGKDVFCEWPLTTDIVDTEQLLNLARSAKIQHVVGLQRRLGPSARFAKDLLAQDFVGQIRSVRMHVSMNYFQQKRSSDLSWTIDEANFSHILSIYGGHFLDLLFSIVGEPASLSAVVKNQFKTITLIETGKSYPNKTPDEVVIIGTLKNGAIFSVQIEGGKRNNSGLQIDITGTEGDLKISNVASFGNKHDNLIEGVKGDNLPIQKIPVPAEYQLVSDSDLDVSVLDLAHLYTAFARDKKEGTRLSPDFDTAVSLHKLINLISQSSSEEKLLRIE